MTLSVDAGKKAGVGRWEDSQRLACSEYPLNGSDRKYSAESTLQTNKLNQTCQLPGSLAEM